MLKKKKKKLLSQNKVKGTLHQQNRIAFENWNRFRKTSHAGSIMLKKGDESTVK